METDEGVRGGTRTTKPSQRRERGNGPFKNE